MSIEFKTLLVEKPINCPMCAKDLKKGDIMYEDDYRNDVLCAYCKEDNIEEVILEEGEDGRLLK